MIIFPYINEKERRTLCVYVCIYGISNIYFLLKDLILFHFLIISFDVSGLCNQIVSSLMTGITFSPLQHPPIKNIFHSRGD